ncbi:uncharacterized protein LOC114183094 [Vigna unguiculata]|uniref:uncharacterized protein LOC114183094 n=1 Tax=Vigna unguiculata TaxID=3917 RepID=UPI001016CB39|nr:uncharacterized protein LOC114183094 [Vigna unguiculata]
MLLGGATKNPIARDSVISVSLFTGDFFRFSLSLSLPYEPFMRRAIFDHLFSFWRNFIITTIAKVAPLRVSLGVLPSSYLSQSFPQISHFHGFRDEGRASSFNPRHRKNGNI